MGIFFSILQGASPIKKNKDFFPFPPFVLFRRNPPPFTSLFSKAIPGLAREEATKNTLIYFTADLAYFVYISIFLYFSSPGRANHVSSLAGEPSHLQTTSVRTQGTVHERLAYARRSSWRLRSKCFFLTLVRLLMRTASRQIASLLHIPRAQQFLLGLPLRRSLAFFLFVYQLHPCRFAHQICNSLNLR